MRCGRAQRTRWGCEEYPRRTRNLPSLLPGVQLQMLRAGRRRGLDGGDEGRHLASLLGAAAPWRAAGPARVRTWFSRGRTARTPRRATTDAQAQEVEPAPLARDLHRRLAAAAAGSPPAGDRFSIVADLIPVRALPVAGATTLAVLFGGVRPPGGRSRPALHARALGPRPGRLRERPRAGPPDDVGGPAPDQRVPQADRVPVGPRGGRAKAGRPLGPRALGREHHERPVHRLGEKAGRMPERPADRGAPVTGAPGTVGRGYTAAESRGLPTLEPNHALWRMGKRRGIRRRGRVGGVSSMKWH